MLLQLIRDCQRQESTIVQQSEQMNHAIRTLEMQTSIRMPKSFQSDGQSAIGHDTLPTPIVTVLLGATLTPLLYTWR